MRLALAQTMLRAHGAAHGHNFLSQFDGDSVCALPFLMRFRQNFGVNMRVADVPDATAAGPQPYNNVFKNGLTGAPNAASAVTPGVPPKTPAKKDDVSGLY